MRQRALWWGGACALLASIAVVYAHALANGFVWDDWTNVVAVRSSRSLGIEGLRWSFGAFVMGHYQPLTWLVYALQERLIGSEAWAYHATSVVLHGLDALLVSALAARLHLLARDASGSSPERPVDVAVGLLTGALFALHPLRVESVAWATQLRDVLSAFFFLAAVGFYLRWVRSRRVPAYLGLVAAFLLCLLSKAQVMLPVALLVLDAYPLRRLGDVSTSARDRWGRLLSLVLEKLPLFALAGAFAWTALLAQAAAGALVSREGYGLAERVAQAAFGLAFYVEAMFGAWAFYPLYERPVPLDPWSPPFVLGMAVALALTLLAAAAARRVPALCAAWAWYVVLLFPVLGLFQSGVQLVADRYSYLACLGFALAAAAGVAAGWGRMRGAARIAVAAGAAAGLLVWGGLARRQTAVWRDDTTLWRHVLRRGPSAMAYNNLGSMAAHDGDLAGAVEGLRLSLETIPSYSRPWATLIRIFEVRPEAVTPDEARRLADVLRRSLAFHRGSAAAHYALGLVLARAGEPAGALRELDEALRLEPGHAGARRARHAVEAP